MTARFTNKGRADPWSIPSPHRCHSVRIPGTIHPADNQRGGVGTWVYRVVLGVCAVYAAYITVTM